MRKNLQLALVNGDLTKYDLNVFANMKAPVILVSIVLTLLVIPAASSTPIEFSEIDEDFEGCFGENTQIWATLYGGTLYAAGENIANLNPYEPGETWEMSIQIGEPNPDDPRSGSYPDGNVMFHLIVNDGILSSVNNETVVLDNGRRLTFNETFVDENPAINHGIYFNFTFPTELSGMHQIDFDIYAMEDDGDGMVSEDDKCSINQYRYASFSVFDNKFGEYHHGFVSNDEQASACYQWAFFNWDQVDESLFTWGCPYMDSTEEPSDDKAWDERLKSLNPNAFDVISIFLVFAILGNIVMVISVLRLKKSSNETLHNEEEISRVENSKKTAEPRSEPVTFLEILESLDAHLKEAIGEANSLREELEETKTRVETLEHEVQEKDDLIDEIKASKSSFSEQMDNRSKKEEGKSLSLTDSVMVGDSIIGGVKIDKQINNDPEAIARAVIDAFRAGRGDE
ncbi:MAG TPA: hypothetical protein HA353_02610 [Candidatus Poseidonia sp.]|nr:hypothetical protein [Poseidonia sp.]